MLKIFSKLWDGVKSLFLLAFPMCGSAGTAVHDAASPGRWLGRLVLGAFVLSGLALINRLSVINLSTVVRFSHFGKFWLPLFAACLYALLWLGWLLWRVLNLEIEPISSEFPDIDQAWSSALEALANSQIPIETTPLFLVLGWSSSPEEALFQAAGIKGQVKQAPRDPDAPLHVTANQEGIWVTCGGASLLGQQKAGGGDSYPQEATLGTLAENTSDPFKTMGLGKGETMRIEDLLPQLVQAQTRERRTGTRKVAEPERHKARLRHLCQLIVRDRRGFCPANGVLVLLPITAADAKSDIDELASACRIDLSMAFSTLKIRCPVLFMVGDLDRLPGFTTLVERLPAREAGKRMGQRFPLVPDLDQTAVPNKLGSSVEWTTGNLFPSMVQSLFQVESPGGEDVSGAIRANAQLFRFLRAMHSRQERVTALVRKSIPERGDEPLLIGGCYFAGTGADAAERAFAAGVLMRLVQEQDNVRWTSDTVDQDDRSRRFARVLKVIFLILIALELVAAGLVIARWVASGGEAEGV